MWICFNLGRNNGLKSRLDMKNNKRCTTISLPTSLCKHCFFFPFLSEGGVYLFVLVGANTRGLLSQNYYIQNACSYIPSVKKVSPQNGGFIRAKLTRPRTFCYKNNVRKIQNGGFIRAKSGPLIRHQARILYLLIL